MKSIYLFLFLIAAVLWLAPTPVFAQPACTHYASPSGSGSSCTVGTPCLVNSFWALAAPGSVLCLNDGVYTGGNSMIHPPTTLSGTAGNPITIRALNDGQVLLDAQNGTEAVFIGDVGSAGSSWFVVQGINARNGYESLYRLRGSNNILSRVVGWDGTEGLSDSNIFRLTGTNNRCIDCAGWGQSSRKIFDAAQGGNVGQGGFRRTWAEWNDHPLGPTNPTGTYQLGYNTTNQLWENILGTWDTTGDHHDEEGVLGAFYNTVSANPDMGGTKVLGAIFYATNTTNFTPGWLSQAGNVKNLYYENVVGVLGSAWTSKKSFEFFGCEGGGDCSGNVCQSCMDIHAGTPSGTSDWSFPNFRQGNGLAAATGGTSPFLLMPGLCYRYEDGVLTSTPLWPWPMNQRIIDARTLAGRTPLDITATIESLLGTIPAQCRSDSTDTTPPTVSITAPSNGATVSGSIAVTANASDDVGVVGVQFKLDGVNLGAEDTTSTYGITWDTTTASNGSHALTAVARDAATNTTTSTTITVTVNNGDTTPPTVSITAPSNGATISGRAVSVTANAADNIGVVGVQFKLDGNILGAEDTTSPYGITWDTIFISDGAHTLTAVARDAAGNITTSSGISVTVANNPTIVVISANSTITFLGNPTSVGTSGNASTPTLTNPTGLSITASGTITFLTNPTGVSITASGTLTFLTNPTSLSIVIQP